MIVGQVLGRSLFALGSPFSLAIKSESLFHLRFKVLKGLFFRDGAYTHVRLIRPFLRYES